MLASLAVQAAQAARVKAGPSPAPQSAASCRAAPYPRVAACAAVVAAVAAAEAAAASAPVLALAGATCARRCPCRRSWRRSERASSGRAVGADARSSVSSTSVVVVDEAHLVLLGPQRSCARGPSAGVRFPSKAFSLLAVLASSLKCRMPPSGPSGIDVVARRAFRRPCDGPPVCVSADPLTVADAGARLGPLLVPRAESVSAHGAGTMLPSGYIGSFRPWSATFARFPAI